MMRKSLKKIEHLQKEANKEIRGSKKESSEAKPMLRIKPQQQAARAQQIAAPP